MAYIRTGGGSKGNVDMQPFVVQGNSGATFGTNFTIGKRYIIMYGDGATASAIASGATIIESVDTNMNNLEYTHILYVEATSTTITVNSAHGSAVMPFEFTEI